MTQHDHDCSLHTCWRPIGTCANCGRPVQLGQPYMGRIPFIGTHGGIVHQHCPPVLRVLRGGR